MYEHLLTSPGLLSLLFLISNVRRGIGDVELYQRINSPTSELLTGLHLKICLGGIDARRLNNILRRTTNVIHSNTSQGCHP